MEVQAKILTTDTIGRVFFTASDEDIDNLYLDRLAFWTDRHGAMEREEIREKAISGQAQNYDRGMKKPLGSALEELYGSTPPDCFLSILELGGADGVTLRHLQANFPDFRVLYTGIEPCSAFVESLKSQFPEVHAEVADAETFVGMPVDAFPHKPYGAFVASLSLCMIKPGVVRDVLARAADLCDEA